jgi:hypothetical protein
MSRKSWLGGWKAIRPESSRVLNILAFKLPSLPASSPYYELSAMNYELILRNLL